MIYLDASVLTAVFVVELRSVEAREIATGGETIASDLALAEVSSAIARRVRAGEIDRQEADAKFGRLDAWVRNAIRIEDLQPADFQVAIALIRRIELGLRTPDALHIAVAMRLGAELATFDERMAAAARGGRADGDLATAAPNPSPTNNGHGRPLRRPSRLPSLGQRQR